MTLKLARGVEPLEGTEELVGVGHVEAGAVVADEECRDTVLYRLSHFDPCLRTLTRKFPSVAKQVLEDVLQEAGIACRQQSIFHAKLNRAGRARTVILEARTDVASVDRLAPRSARQTDGRDTRMANKKRSILQPHREVR
jgi:hypothetical protein